MKVDITEKDVARTDSAGRLLLALDDKQTRKQWVVRIVRPNQLYGVNDAVRNDSGESLVEFHMVLNPGEHEADCWFVSRYYLSTLIESNQEGIMLDGGLKIEASASLMAELKQHLAALELAPGEISTK